MRDVVFAMELRGRAAPVEGSPNTLTARTGGRGPHGETVAFESRVVLSGETFNETGSIDYSGYGKVTFETVGAGHLGPSPHPRAPVGCRHLAHHRWERRVCRGVWVYHFQFYRLR
jgi:hypothetical protein